MRRNYLLGLLNGGIFSLGDALQDTNLVLSVFVNQLSGSNVFVGFLQPLRLGGWFLPQLLLSGRVQAAPQKMPFYRLGATLRIASVSALAASTFLVTDRQLLLALMFLFLGTFSLTGGLSGLAYMDVVAKTIPSRMRGGYFAWRMFLGGLLALLGSLVVRHVLSDTARYQFPRNYAILFLLAAFAIGISMTAFAFTKEPRDGQVQPRASLPEQLRRAGSLPRGNADYRHFLVARVLLMVAEIASPFYILYASAVVGLPTAMAGTYLMVATAANIASTYFWGRVSDRAGNRALLRIACALGGVAPLVALTVLPLARAVGGASGAVATILFGVVFATLGASRTAVNVGGQAFLLDIAPAHDRPIYLGFTNTLVGIASLTNVLGGFIVEALGYWALFALALAFYAGAGVAITRAAEPRSLGEVSSVPR
ncbi:MAG: hypothetical protein HPY83_14240 [Anaerolineae bacterium]|nr:hypothetical protein [Anaerolineae bacterium]